MESKKDNTIITKKKTLIHPECQSNEFISVSFATNLENKYLCTMSGAPDWILIYWQWDKQRVLATVSVDKASVNSPIYDISINPFDHNSICCFGNGIFHNYKFQDGALKKTTTQQSKKNKAISTNYISHVWIKDSN